MVKRPLNVLINTEEYAWPLVLEWLSDGRNKFEVLDTTRKDADNVLYELQVSTRSPMGVIAYESGGILIDHGWLRILGSSNDRICGDLLYWNGLGQVHIDKPLKGAKVYHPFIIKNMKDNHGWDGNDKSKDTILEMLKYLPERTEEVKG